MPILSLYGRYRLPPPAWLRDLDVVVIDLQDLAVRCYTYVSTLRYMLESAAEAGKPVVVADRPVPFPGTFDGPMLEPDAESFVGAVHTPLVYGMTPGETALWIRRHYGLELDLRVARMRGYRRESERGAFAPPWIPPSPGIAVWESAWCYPATVFTEALPALDCGRTGRLPFQLLGAAWMKPEAVCERLAAARLPGVMFHPHDWTAGNGNRPMRGIRLTVVHPDRFKPVTTGVAILCAVQQVHGRARLWRGARKDFFDRLCGTSAVREALAAGADLKSITRPWPHRPFRAERHKSLLYPPQ